MLRRLLERDLLAVHRARSLARLAEGLAEVLTVAARNAGRFATCLAGFGVVAVAAAIAWWAILFPTVVDNTGLAWGEAMPCIASNSDICSLAMALCGAHHLFGIQHYSPSLFWSGILFLGASLMVMSSTIVKKTAPH